MKKLLILILSIFGLVFTAKSQHQIITINNDTIIGKITSLSDNTYTYWRLTKPKGLRDIPQKDVKQLIAIGPDTIFQIEKTILAKNDTLATADNFTNDVIQEKDKTTGYHLRKAGENLTAAKVVYMCTALATLFMASKQPEGVLIVSSTGAIIATTLEFIGIQHLINAGDKLDRKEYEQNKLKK